MGRIAGGLIVGAILAGLLLYFYTPSYRQQIADQSRQISEMGQRLNQLQAENEQLKLRADTLQKEEAALAAQNDDMKRAIATFKATGKMPALPPAPPK